MTPTPTPPPAPPDAPPYFPIILDGSVGVWFGDLGRIVCMGVGVMLLCLLARGLMLDWRSPTPYFGYRLRVAALGLFALITCLSEIGSLGDPVSLRLPLNTVALVLAVASMIRSPYARPPLPRGDWLEGR